MAAASFQTFEVQRANLDVFRLRTSHIIYDSDSCEHLCFKISPRQSKIQWLDQVAVVVVVCELLLLLWSFVSSLLHRKFLFAEKIVTMQ